jgi:hypothetical protein
MRRHENACGHEGANTGPHAAERLHGAKHNEGRHEHCCQAADGYLGAQSSGHPNSFTHRDHRVRDGPLREQRAGVALPGTNALRAREEQLPRRREEERAEEEEEGGGEPGRGR